MRSLVMTIKSETSTPTQEADETEKQTPCFSMYILYNVHVMYVSCQFRVQIDGCHLDMYAPSWKAVYPVVTFIAGRLSIDLLLNLVVQ